MKRNESKKKVKLYTLKCRACQERKRIQYQDDLFKSKSFKRFKITSPKSPHGTKLCDNGKTVSGPFDVIKLWANHFKTIGTSKCGENEAVNHARVKVPLLEEKSKTKEDHVFDTEFTVEEIELAVRKLKSGKSGGLDGLTPEHLKFCGAVLIIWLKEIFNAIIQLEGIPQCLLEGKLLPIYKGKGKDPLAVTAIEESPFPL